MINIIVAFDNNWAIGKDNKLVWRQSADLKRFKQLTLNKTVVMGRKTYESIGKPLPNRKNIVLTRNNIQIPGVTVINNIDEIYENDYFVIGGSEIYNLFLHKVDRIFATKIDCEIEADTWFPEIDTNHFSIESREYFQKSENNEYNYEFINFVRKNL
jgi:dihydrofolate reductase